MVCSQKFAIFADAMTGPRIISLPKIADMRGDLSVIENSAQIPFRIERVYWLTGVASGDWRHGHAYRSQTELLIALSGSFSVITEGKDGTMKKTLDNPAEGMLIPPMTWRELHDFSAGAVALVLSSASFNEDDYIRSHDLFLTLIGREAWGS